MTILLASTIANLCLTVISWANQEPLSDEEHGRKQIETMFQDRPFMAAYTEAGFPKLVRSDDSIYIWLLKRFSDCSEGYIFWDSSPPNHGASDHTLQFSDRPGMLRLAPTKNGGEGQEPLSFDELWSNVVYEFCSYGRAAEMRELWKEAVIGRVSKEEFVRASARINHGTLGELQRFYHEEWLPWCGMVSRKPGDKELWFRSFDPDFEAWFKRAANTEGYQQLYDELQKSNPFKEK